MKDCIADKGSGKKKYVPIGRGEVGLRDQIRVLKSDAYDGFVSVETHFAPKVKGTRECWESLQRILEEIGENQNEEESVLLHRSFSTYIKILH